MEETSEGEARGRLVAAALAGILIAASVGPATAHRRPTPRWRYEGRIRKHKPWTAHNALRSRHSRWHSARTTTTERVGSGEDGTLTMVSESHPSYSASEHNDFHHDLYHLHLRRHHSFRVVARQRGKASWYDYRGHVGSCGKVLRGLFAAHRTWPCGSLVAVKRGNRVVRVRVLDRGPYVDGWVIDLSRRAFRRIGDLGEGVVGVKILRLKRR